MILKAIRELLLTSEAITELVDDQIFPYSLPQGEKPPAIDMRVYGKDLGSQAMTGAPQVFSSEVILDCYSDDDPGVADQIAMEILAIAPGYRGTFHEVTIQGIVSEGGISQDTEGVNPAGNQLRFVSSVSLDVIWSR